MSELDHMDRDPSDRMYGMINERVRAFVAPNISDDDHGYSLDRMWMISDGRTTATTQLEPEKTSFFRMNSPEHPDTSQWSLEDCQFAKVTSGKTTLEKPGEDLRRAMFSAAVATVSGKNEAVTNKGSGTTGKDITQALDFHC